MYRKCLILILLLFFLKPLLSQETNYGPGYQTLLVSNPAFAGSNIDGIFRLSYFNFYPGNNYDLHSFYLSYDSYFSSLHGGVGFYISNDYLGGIINELRSGLSYSYFLQAGKDLYIYAGLSASFFHRGLNFGSAVFPDQIDAMGVIAMPTSDLTAYESTTVFDVGTGLMFIYKKLIGGFAVTHLAQPDLNRNGSSIDRLNRKYMGHFLADIELNTPNYLRIMPLASFELQGRFFTACAGAVFESSYLSFSSMLLVNNNKNIDIQTGFSLRRDKMALFYNYRFNLKSGSSLMPFSLVHQVGLTFTSNNVEKRNKVRTINVPEM